jgi:hypothetical protein
MYEGTSEGEQKKGYSKERMMQGESRLGSTSKDSKEKLKATK